MELVRAATDGTFSNSAFAFVGLICILFLGRMLAGNYTLHTLVVSLSLVLVVVVLVAVVMAAAIYPSYNRRGDSQKLEGLTSQISFASPSLRV
jgi:membrane protein implicated in regulation of membrane protease activity